MPEETAPACAVALFLVETETDADEELLDALKPTGNRTRVSVDDLPHFCCPSLVVVAIVESDTSVVCKQ